MAPVVLKEFILPCDIDTFLKCFWLDSAWYERFLVEKLEDINVTVGEWAPAQEAVGFIRSVRSAHPSKLSFPGLPTHAESLKTHIYQLVDSGNYLTVSIKESNTFRGIPYADYFGVNTEWVVMSQNKASSSFAALSAATSSGARGTSNSSSSSSSSNVSSGTVGSAGSGGVGGGTGECSVKIMLDIVFHKHTWLQGTIEANTKAELLDVYELWQSAAEEHLSMLQQQARGGPGAAAGDDMEQGLLSGPGHSLGTHGAAYEGVSASTSSFMLLDPFRPATPPPLTRVTSRSSMASSHTAGGRGRSPRPPGGSSSSSSGNNARRDRDRDSRSDCDSRGGTSAYGSDDELQFYDCDEEAGEHPAHGGGGGGGGGGGHGPEPYPPRSAFERTFLEPISLADVASASASGGGVAGRHRGDAGLAFYRGPMGLLGTDNRPLTTPEKMRLLYADHGVPLNLPSPTSGRRWQHAPSDETSARDLAVSVVETLFVLAEFSFWKVHRVYTHDLKVLFDIAPAQVFTRVLNSFIPGWHSPLLLKPDLYGPLIAVFIMPQILLLSMGVTRHGCNQTSLLGNAVIVSLCLWWGLSALYRLLAFVIAPTINMRHCLSVTGYSFFAWDLALLLLYPMEIYQDYTGLPAMLPLVLLGLPSSLAQGCMFWEHTPASSLEVQPARFPSSLQQCAQQHLRCLQRLAWAVPKILAFVVVTGTHYQFLWYVARVFLPGKKELCQLSALMQPSQYADIITQKELRKYAQMLLSGKKAHDD